MLLRIKRSHAVSLAISILVGAEGCHHDQLRTARVFSESPGQIEVAMPENTKGYRKLADQIAEKKLGKNYTFVGGKEVITGDVDSKVRRTGFVKKGDDTQAVHRREYHMIFKSTGNGGDADQGVR